MEFEIVDEWYDHLIWCPSQCYLPIRVNNENYTIYLRWRHHDPWTCSIAKGHSIILKYRNTNEKWYFITEDLFSMYGYYFTKDDDLDKIHNAAIECAKVFLSRLLNGKCVICGNEAYTNIKPNPYKDKIVYSVCKDHYIDHLHKLLRSLIDNYAQITEYIEAQKDFSIRKLEGLGLK